MMLKLVSFLISAILLATSVFATDIDSSGGLVTRRRDCNSRTRYPQPSGTFEAGVYTTNWRCRPVNLPLSLYKQKYPALAKVVEGSTCTNPNFQEARLAIYMLDADEETLIGPIARPRIAVKRCNDECENLWEQGHWVESRDASNYKYDALYDVTEQQLLPQSFKGDTTTCETFSYDSPTQNVSPNNIFLFPNSWFNTQWLPNSEGVFGGNVFVNKKGTNIWNGMGVTYSTNTTLSPHLVTVHKWVPVSASYFPGLPEPMLDNMMSFSHPSLMARDVVDETSSTGTFTFTWNGATYEAPRDLVVRPNYDALQHVRRIQ